MRHLFYFYSCFNATFLGGLLDEAIELAKNKGNEVLFVFCGGHNELCFFNRGGSRLLCAFCSRCTRKVIENNGVKCASLIDYKIKSNNSHFEYSTAEELRAIKYKGVSIGLGIMSGYISETRNLDPIINDETKLFFDAHIAQDINMVDSVFNLIEQFRPDEFHTFNGRYEEVRAIWDICHTNEIKCNLYEGIHEDGKWEKVIFINHLPHDIKYNAERRDYAWEHYDMSEEQKIELGKSFFEYRRKGIYAGDRIYIKDQKKGNIPPIEKTKINIGIFNSSEDEFAAVGGEWDLLKFFKSQKEGIEYMLNNSSSQIHFYLRIHPNLKNNKYKYNTELLSLEEKYRNITVIPGGSDISTYDLLDNMDKVVCFGSTMGIESSYWKVPTILLGPAMYYYEDICYKPNSKEELLSMLVSDLKPKFNKIIYRFGAYYLNKSPLVISNKNIDFQLTSRKLFGLSYHSTPYISFFINDKITALFIGIGRYLFGKRLFNRYVVPVKEA